MIEGRGVISDIKETGKKIEELGGVYKSDYAFKDIIFFSENGTLKVRVMTKKNWPTKDVIVIRKQSEFKEVGKIDSSLLRKEFDTEKEAVDFVERELPEFKPELEYSRHGWQYELDGSRIFVEDIEFLGPSVEIEADSEEVLKALFKKMGIDEVLGESIPEAIKRIKK